MQIKCLCSVPDYYAAWLIVLKIAENGKQTDLAQEEKAKIVTRLAQGKKPLKYPRNSPVITELSNDL